MLRSDQQILSVILSNLIDNACKYSPSETRVCVTADIDQAEGTRSLVIAVDNQPINEDWPDADRLFSKYYRSQNAHRVTGSGLGLYLVDQFTRMLGGTVVYRPTHDKVRFVLSLPL